MISIVSWNFQSAGNCCKMGFRTPGLSAVVCDSSPSWFTTWLFLCSGQGSSTKYPEQLGLDPEERKLRSDTRVPSNQVSLLLSRCLTVTNTSKLQAQRGLQLSSPRSMTILIMCITFKYRSISINFWQNNSESSFEIYDIDLEWRDSNLIGRAINCRPCYVSTGCSFHLAAHSLLPFPNKRALDLFQSPSAVLSHA